MTPCAVAGHALALALCASLAAASAEPLDVITLGDPESEAAHGFRADRGEAFTGGLAESARRLLPRTPPEVLGGRLSFALRCDPAAVTYVTVRLWGSDQGSDLGRLMLVCEGKQVGYQHLGDVDPIDIAGDAPACPGRFFKVRQRLNDSLTRILAGNDTSELLKLTLLARAYHVEWAVAFHRDEVLTKVVAGVDDLVRRVA